MRNKRIFIQGAEQISIQLPLSEEWMTNPIDYHQTLVCAIDPNFRDYISPSNYRRMGGLMKRAIVTALKVMSDTGINHPDAIITGTGMGNLEYTESIIQALKEPDANAISPSHFMQSTHNTISSALAIHTNNSGYNNTFSHGEISFDLALQDAFIQMKLGLLSSALIGGHDEMTPNFFSSLIKTGDAGLPGMVACSEANMSMMLTADANADSLCELVGIRLLHRPSINDLRTEMNDMLNEINQPLSSICAVLTGINGNPTNDAPYIEFVNTCTPDVPHLKFKHLFGESYSSSALGVYAISHILKKGYMPICMFETGNYTHLEHFQSILIVNHSKFHDYTLMLLNKCF